jgi:hypothetical protein
VFFIKLIISSKESPSVPARPSVPGSFPSIGGNGWKEETDAFPEGPDRAGDRPGERDRPRHRDTVTAGLAVELAPIRVNAIAPGTIDTGAYDALGDDGKAALFAARSAANPARRIGTAEDIAAAALTALTNGFLTGVSIPVDGGEHLV